jgi:hypothetical protein
MGNDLSQAKQSIDLVGDASKTKAVALPVIKIAVAPQVTAPGVPGSGGTGAARLPLLLDLLPAVLAGPIVRRAQDTHVYIWICTAIPVVVDVRIFDVSPDNPLATGSQPTQPFGAQLHAVLVPVVPSPKPFPRDTLLYYQMTLTAKEGTFLGDVCFHASDLAYGGAAYPAFVLPSESTPSVLIQGSCRKVHGNGKDAMKSADAFAASVAAQPTKRPQQILFTGDQIYADDVHDGVLTFAQQLGPILLGFDEIMPLDTPKPASKIPGGKGADQRGGLVRAAGFTSDVDACVNHLMAFSDFVVMYLVSWSGQMWDYARKAAPGAGFDKLNFEPAAAQRLMANVPTYMMCDDHEVTDDWYIDSVFADRSTNSPLTRRILFNAIANYWLFQAWGNDPDQFAGRGFAVQRYLNSLAVPDVALERSFAGHFLGGVSQPRPFKWSFVTPAPASVIMMDTRTRRILRTAPKAAALLNDDALEELGRWLSDAPPNQPVIIVSPPPVFGFVALEWLQEQIVKRMSVAEFYEKDFETWAANGEGFRKFLHKIAESGRRRIVFFAGDVHYAFANSVAYCFIDLPSSAVEVLHLTSSSIKNKMSGGQSFATTQLVDPFNTNSAHTFGVIDGDDYSRRDDSLGLGTLREFLDDGDLGNPSHALYLNWRFHGMYSPSALVTDNNIGVFTIERGTADPVVTNEYIDESGSHWPLSGKWSNLMLDVQPPPLTQRRWKR